MADTYDIAIEQGATWSRVFTYTEDDGTTPINLTGYTGRAQIRRSPMGRLLADFTVSINGAAGEVTLSLTATQTAELYEDGVYDIELVNGATVIRLVQGKVTVNAGVTLP